MEDVIITFTFNGEDKILDCKKEEYMIEIYRRFGKKIQVDIKKLFFLYNGDMINPEQKLKNIIKNDDKNIKMIVNQMDDDDDEEKEIILKQSKDIICPICNEISLINLNDYKISFNICQNGHRFTNLMLDEYFDFQKIDESKIICDKCEGKDKNKKSEVNNNIFYKCFTCNINLCPLCKVKHDKMHLIFYYGNKNYLCINMEKDIYLIVKNVRKLYMINVDMMINIILHIIKFLFYMNQQKKQKI